MLLKYTGHIPSFLYEFNGKRYMFTNRGDVVDMPPEAVRHLYSSRTPNAMDIIPIESAEVTKIEQENLSLKREVEELNKIVADLEKRIKKDGRKK